MPSTVVTTLSTAATIGSTSDRSASTVTAAPVLHHPRPMPPMMPKATSTIDSIHSAASTSSYTSSSVSAHSSSAQAAHKVNLTQGRPKLIFPPSSSGAAKNIQAGSSSGMMFGATVPAPVPVSAPSQIVQWNPAPAPAPAPAVQPRALSPVSPEELKGAISLARKGSAMKESGRVWMSGGLEATFGSKGSRSRSVSPVPPPSAKVEASVPIVAPTPVRVTSVAHQQHQQHQQQSRRRSHAARQSDVPSSSHGPHHHGPGSASTRVTYSHAPSAHQQQNGRPTTLNRRNTSSSSSFAQQQQYSSSSSASQSIYSSQLHERKRGSRPQSQEQHQQRHHSQQVQPSEDLNVPPSHRASLKEAAATSGAPPPPLPPVAMSRRPINHRNPSQEPVGPASLPQSLERTDSRSHLSTQPPPRPPPEQEPSRQQMRTQQRTRSSAPAMTQKQIVQFQRIREQEERERQEREWRAHQAQPTPHQQLVQEVENLPTNQRSSFLLQRSGSFFDQSYSRNSSALGHSSLNGSGSHIASTAVSAWTGRGVEIGTGSGTNTNVASISNVNRNISKLSVAVNVGGGVRRGSADNSHPSHGDDEDDEELARTGSSGVYDIRSWLAHKGSRSSYFNVGGVTGPSAALVEQMGGVAPFVTLAKPQVDRSVGTGTGTGTSAVPTPTTAVQSHVRFPPDHLFVTLESKKTIKIHNLPPPNAHDKSYQNHSVIKAVRRQVVGLWPGGSKEDVEERGEWWVKLGGEGNAWGADGNGSEGVTARRMVAQLFKVFAAEGYSYLCSVHTSRPFQSARHVFASAPAVPDSNFFVLSFSLNRRKVSLIDAPPAIINDLKKALMHAAPYGLQEDGGKGGKGSRRKKSSTSSEHPAFSENQKSWSLAGSTTSIVADRQDYLGGAGRTATSRGVFTVRLKNRHPISRPKNETPLFLPRNEDSDMLSTLSNLMKVFTTHNYRLDASVPMGRAKGIRGWFGLRGRREIWVFKEVEFQTMASK